MKNILIVKFGALGDVVRTSYFARELKKNKDVKLFWITSEASSPLLSGNLHIDFLARSFDDLKDVVFDHVYSLDDELEIVRAVGNLQFLNLSGGFLADGRLQYTEDVSEWFDMGLLSKYGKTVADELKKSNVKSHGEIFKKIFGVSSFTPSFSYPKEYKQSSNLIGNAKNDILVGINPYAGGRWPSKELLDSELEKLIEKLLRIEFLGPLKIILMGSGNDRHRNGLIKSKFNVDNIFIADTDESLLDFAFQIKQLDYLVTSDSLALHLSLSQGVRSTAFFAPTSATEIDSFGLCDKVISLSNDYCNYSKVCDNTTITAERLINSLQNNMVKR